MDTFRFQRVPLNPYPDLQSAQNNGRWTSDVEINAIIVSTLEVQGPYGKGPKYPNMEYLCVLN